MVCMIGNFGSAFWSSVSPSTLFELLAHGEVQLVYSGWRLWSISVKCWVFGEYWWHDNLQNIAWSVHELDQFWILMRDTVCDMNGTLCCCLSQCFASIWHYKRLPDQYYQLLNHTILWANTSVQDVRCMQINGLFSLCTIFWWQYVLIFFQAAHCFYSTSVNIEQITHCKAILLHQNDFCLLVQDLVYSCLAQTPTKIQYTRVC